jgi:hypothetical protein
MCGVGDVGCVIEEVGAGLVVKMAGVTEGCMNIEVAVKNADFENIR